MRMQRINVAALVAAEALLAMCSIGLAQAPPPLQVRPFGGDLVYAVEGELLDETVVTGAPYSAQSVTETIQTLSDGNQINRKETATIYRDSEGRKRREITLGMIGPWSPDNGAHPMTIIVDPVAGTRYMLNVERKTAFKMPLPSPQKVRQFEKGRLKMKLREKAEGDAQESQAGTPFFFADGQKPPGAATVYFAEGEVTSESLGTQATEGVEAQGTRVKDTIPAGKVGNLRPLTIISERWYSPELQLYVMTKRSDPRFGDTVYRLTNISRAEPSASLFQVPADYTIKDGPADFSPL